MMDENIFALIDGSRRISKHIASHDDYYWKFPLDYIKEIPYLDFFIKQNGEIDAQTLNQNKLPDIGGYSENYRRPLVVYQEDQVLIGDLMRFALLNFCIHLLRNDIERFITNIKGTMGLRHEDKNGNMVSYHASEQQILFEIFLRGIRNPISLCFLVRGPIYMNFVGERYYINLHKLEDSLKRCQETYDFSKWSMP